MGTGNLRKQKIVEEIGLAIEESGKPRISGLIMGWLMVCDPPHQSFSDLVENLQISKASVSNMTRMLIQSGLIEKKRIPGERQIYFQIKKTAWVDILKSELTLIHSLQELSEKGLEIMKDEKETDKSRLKEMNNFYSFIAQRLTKTLDEYKQKKSD